MNLREAVTQATTQLKASPDLCADANRDAVLLLLHMLGIARATLHADPYRILTGNEQIHYDSLIQRRLTNEPIQYITGEQEFYGLTLHVTPAVLIPRPETEHLVEAVLAELESTASLHILDVGTGSGAIAIALAHHLPNAYVTAVDISAAALEVAVRNAVRHNLSNRIQFVESDLLAAISTEARFDAIVSNPPYVAVEDYATLHPQVRDFEPGTALFAGHGGINIYQRLIPQARVALKPHGLLALEIGHNQLDAITGLLQDWDGHRFVDDLQHIPRVALARKP